MLKNYFLGSNTYKGFSGEFSHLLDGRAVILKGGAGSGKSTLMKKVAEIATDAGFETEIYRCSSDADSLDGVYVKSKNFAVIDGTSPHTADAEYHLFRHVTLNLLDKADAGKTISFSDEIEKAIMTKKQYFSDAYAYLGCAKILKDNVFEKEKRAHDTSSLDKLALHAFDIVKNTSSLKEKRYVCAITDKGFIDYLDENSKSLKRVGIKANGDYPIIYVVNRLLKLLDAHDIGYRTYTSPIYGLPDAVETGDFIVAGFARLSDAEFIIEETSSADLSHNADVAVENAFANNFISRAMENIRLAHLTHMGIEGLYSPSIDWTDVNNKTDKVLCMLFDC
ncbi:MAG: hypothetical protein MSH44_04250 [Christensenellaceae bacterium]|nr:hypothetical protein [Christensenellaceae bacterium]